LCLSLFRPCECNSLFPFPSADLLFTLINPRNIDSGLSVCACALLTSGIGRVAVKVRRMRLEKEARLANNAKSSADSRRPYVCVPAIFSLLFIKERTSHGGRDTGRSARGSVLFLLKRKRSALMEEKRE